VDWKAEKPDDRVPQLGSFATIMPQEPAQPGLALDFGGIWRAGGCQVPSPLKSVSHGSALYRSGPEVRKSPMFCKKRLTSLALARMGRSMKKPSPQLTNPARPPRNPPRTFKEILAELESPIPNYEDLPPLPPPPKPQRLREIIPYLRRPRP